MVGDLLLDQLLLPGPHDLLVIGDVLRGQLVGPDGEVVQPNSSDGCAFPAAFAKG